jgi:hypothetical protein
MGQALAKRLSRHEKMRQIGSKRGFFPTAATYDIAFPEKLMSNLG